MNQYFWMLVDCSQLWEEGQTRVSFLSDPCRMPIVLILKCFSNFAPWFNHLTGPNDKPHLSSCFNDKTSFIKDPGKLLFVKLDYSTIAPGQGNKRAQQAAPEFAEFVCTMREKRQTLEHAVWMLVFRAKFLQQCSRCWQGVWRTVDQMHKLLHPFVPSLTWDECLLCPDGFRGIFAALLEEIPGVKSLSNS